MGLVKQKVLQTYRQDKAKELFIHFVSRDIRRLAFFDAPANSYLIKQGLDTTEQMNY
jgi:hypothetical protein